MSTLLTEILACIFAAAFLSLFIGWALRSVFANRELESTNTEWQKKYSEQELLYLQDKEQLDAQVQSLEDQTTTLSASNRTLTESLRDNEISVQKARTDAIELNRQQAETQERLQLIISQKEQELKSLRSDADVKQADASANDAKTNVEVEETNARIASLSAKREAWEKDRRQLLDEISEDQATVAIDPGDVPVESLDQTVRLGQNHLDRMRSKASNSDNKHGYDLDQTQTLDNPSGNLNDKDKQ